MFSARVDEGLELRLFELRHAELLFEVVQANREHLAPWMPWAESVSVENQRAFIAGGLKQFADGNGFQCGIWYEGQLVGGVGLHYLRWDTKRTEIGYWLAEGVQGQGMVTRVCRHLLRYIFEELKFNRVEIRCALGNVRSRAVPERLGFKQEGVLRQVDKLPSGWVDWVIYGLLAEEWEER